MSGGAWTDRRLAALAARIGARFAAKGQRLTTAESCTGGWISKSLTDIPGSSAWFETGYVTYGNGAKTRLLGVPESLLTRHGAVSEAVVAAMARGALARAPADAALAVSGIAGPDGGTPGKPVGTVWFAWARRSGRGVRLRTRRVRFTGNREAVRRKAVATALAGVLAS